MKILPVIFLSASTIIRAAPSPSEWARLAQSLGPDKLLADIRPPAAPCHKAAYNASECAFVVANWQNATWRSSQIGAMQAPIWEQLGGHWCDIAFDSDGNPTNSTGPVPSPCPQGNVPQFGVNASTPQDIQKAVQFANDFSVPLVIKGTGHDFLGRSSDPGRLLIWTHYMKNITFGSVQICGTDHPDTLTVAAGVQWGEAYDALADHQRVVPGGADGDVGASGGQMMGGGHSPLSNTYGLTPDSVIQLEVVTLDGVFRTVNRCANTDLFWALRGGGGGTYAIVTSTTYQTYPDGPTATVNFSYNNSAPGVYAKALDIYGASSAQLAEMGWSGYFAGALGSTNGVFYLPLINNITFEQATQAWAPVLKAFNDTEGLDYISAAIDRVPSAASFLSPKTSMDSTDSGFAGLSAAPGSRLIPKSTLQDPVIRANVTQLIASFEASAYLLSGGVPSHPTDSAVLPAWRKALWHVTFGTLFPTDASNAVIEQTFRDLTKSLEPLRQATPGSGAYMNEADARAPAWKEDFFGENYDKLLAIKRKWDPKGLLSCNRCVGSND